MVDGTPVTEVKRLVGHWLNNYNWRIHEAEINTLPKYIHPLNIDGFDTLNIHFVHKTSHHTNAIPLIFIHGWPGHFYEVSKVLPLLVNRPERHSKPFTLSPLPFPGSPFVPIHAEKGLIFIRSVNIQQTYALSQLPHVCRTRRRPR